MRTTHCSLPHESASTSWITLVSARADLFFAVTSAVLVQEAQLPLWLRPYEVLVTSNRTALIEMIPDSLSIHTIKAKSAPGTSLRDHFIARHGQVHISQRLVDTQTLLKAQTFGFCFVLAMLHASVPAAEFNNCIRISLSNFYLMDPVCRCISSPVLICLKTYHDKLHSIFGLSILTWTECHS